VDSIDVKPEEEQNKSEEKPKEPEEPKKVQPQGSQAQSDKDKPPGDQSAKV